MKYPNNLLRVLLMICVVGACNKPADETGNDLVQDDAFDPSFEGEIDIFFMANNTLYGIRDNNGPNAGGVGSIDLFLEVDVPSTSTITASPYAFHKTNFENSIGDYRDIAMAVATNDGYLQVYDVPLNTLLWRTYLNGELRHAPLRAFQENGVPYLMIGTASGSFYGLDAANGEIVWVFDSPNGAAFEAPTVSLDFVGQGNIENPVVFAPTSDGWVYALDSADGALLWSYDTGSLIASKPIFVQPSFNFPDLDESLVITNQDGTVVRLDTLGNPIWRRNTPQQAAVVSAATYNPFDGTLLIPSDNRKIHNLVVEDGSIDWEYRLPSGLRSSITQVSNKKYYAFDTEGTLFGFDKPSFGAEEWRTSVPNAQLGSASTPNLSGFSVGELRIYVQTPSGIYGYNTRGRLFSQFEISGNTVEDDVAPIYASPVIIANTRTIFNPKNIED